MLFPAIPDIIKDFKSSYSSSSWILSGYLISAAVMAPLVGKLSDMYGKKKVLSVIMTIFAASIAIAGFSSNMAILIVVRIVEGIGLSMFIIALSIMQSSVPKEKYALANGILASTYFSGSSIGLVLGGSIIHYFGWRTTFFSLIPIVIALLIIVIRSLHVKGIELQERDCNVLVKNGKNKNEKDIEVSNEKKKNNNNNNNSSKSNNHFIYSPNVRNAFFKSLDIRGAAMLAATITLFLTALTYMENDYGNKSAADDLILIIGLLGSAVISLIVFIVAEKKAASPLVDLN